MGKLGPQLKYVGAAALLLVLAAPWLPVPPYWVTLLTYVGLSSIVAIGLVILTGAAGMTSLGQAAFVGIGAYCTAYVTTHLGYSPWIGLVASILVTGASAFLIGLFTMKLSGYYLPICTIAWGLALYYLFGNLEILGRHDGIIGIPSISLFGFELSSQASMHVFIWLFVAFSYITASNLLDSRMGRALRSLKFGLVMPEAMGVHTARLKVVLFVYAANLAGLSGWLYAHLQHAVSPTPFSLKYGVDYLVMVVVGGASEVAGALLGAGLVTLLGSVLQEWLPQLVGSTSNFEAIAFGILLVLILQHASDGIWPFIRARLGGRSSARAPAKAQLLSHRPPPAAEEVVLRVEHARKQFGGLVAVNDLSFQVRAGEIVGLIGPNGAGKSTIFNLITGVDEPTSGSISFRGKPVTHLPSREIAARGIARTFQHVRLVPGMSVLENVAVGCHLRGRRPQWVENLLQAVPTDWLRELVAFLPVGFEAFLSSMRLDRKREEKALFEAKRQVERVGLGDLMYEDAGSIALGHQRILEIARALCSDPTLLLLDEPAAGLRMHEKAALAELLKALRADGMAILLVEHDMGFVMQLTDHIVVVERGAKIAEGKPKEMYEHPAVREAYLGGAD